jgi:hypothetical protein
MTSKKINNYSGGIYLRQKEEIISGSPTKLIGENPRNGSKGIKTSTEKNMSYL